MAARLLAALAIAALAAAMPSVRTGGKVKAVPPLRPGSQKIKAGTTKVPPPARKSGTAKVIAPKTGTTKPAKAGTTKSFGILRAPPPPVSTQKKVAPPASGTMKRIQPAPYVSTPKKTNKKPVDPNTRRAQLAAAGGVVILSAFNQVVSNPGSGKSPKRVAPKAAAPAAVEAKKGSLPGQTITTLRGGPKQKPVRISNVDFVEAKTSKKKAPTSKIPPKVYHESKQDVANRANANLLMGAGGLAAFAYLLKDGALEDMETDEAYDAAPIAASTTGATAAVQVEEAVSKADSAKAAKAAKEAKKIAAKEAEQKELADKEAALKLSAEKKAAAEKATMLQAEAVRRAEKLRIEEAKAEAARLAAAEAAAQAAAYAAGTATPETVGGPVTKKRGVWTRLKRIVTFKRAGASA